MAAIVAEGRLDDDELEFQDVNEKPHEKLISMIRPTNDDMITDTKEWDCGTSLNRMLLIENAQFLQAFKSKLVNQLIKIADKLDRAGMIQEANNVDDLLQDLQSSKIVEQKEVDIIVPIKPRRVDSFAK